MASNSKPEIILYDLACTKNVCFSPVVWRIRLMLNYKRIPYQTIFLEFPDIEPTLKGLGVPPTSTEPKPRYTVPTIHHLPSNTYITNSDSVAHFLESTYPDPPLPLTSELGQTIQSKIRTSLGKVSSTWTIPREALILSPRANEYFCRNVEAALGHPPEDLRDPDKEEQSWNSINHAIREIDDLIQAHRADGPFVLGTQLSYIDFSITGSLQSLRVIDEGLFERYAKYPGFRGVYEACLPYMQKKD